MGKRQLTGAALTAKVIKQRLKKLYPLVKFSVTSDTFSMGDSVDIRWTDGPLQDAVNAITKQYQHGNFNSMEDMYEYENIDESLGCDGAKYVFCHRSISDERRTALIAKANEYFGQLDPSDHHTYQRRLAKTEEMFFDYPETEANPSAISIQGNRVMEGLEYEVNADVDTRDNSEIFVVKVKTRVDDFASLRQIMDSLGGYYSRFKRGFIFKEDPTASLNGVLSDSDNPNAIIPKGTCA